MSGANSQDIIDLKSYLTSVVAHSFGSRQAQSQLKRAEADFSLFRSQLKPQFSINAFLPTFTRTSASVTQPNGSIAFQSVYQNIGSFSVFAQQPILLTGGTLFAETSLDRFDDFSQRSKIFNGIPIRIGYRQNLIGFNQWKWAKKIEENRLFTNKKQFSFEIENIQMQAVFLYFDALIAQSNLAIADSNRMVNEKLLIIAEERLDLGKISKDEKLQMEAEYKQAVMQLAQSENLYKQTKINIQNILVILQKSAKPY